MLVADAGNAASTNICHLDQDIRRHPALTHEN